MRLCLGIEGTAHTLGVGIISENGEVLVNEKSVYKPKQGGINPAESMRFMRDNGPETLQRALESLEKKGHFIDEIVAVAYSRGPGLGNLLALN